MTVATIMNMTGYARCGGSCIGESRTELYLERAGDYTSRLALREEAKTLPFGAVWDFYCLQQNVPVGEAWLAEVKAYDSRS